MCIFRQRTSPSETFASSPFQAKLFCKHCDQHLANDASRNSRGFALWSECFIFAHTGLVRLSGRYELRIANKWFFLVPTKLIASPWKGKGRYRLFKKNKSYYNDCSRSSVAKKNCQNAQGLSFSRTGWRQWKWSFRKRGTNDLKGEMGLYPKTVVKQRSKRYRPTQVLWDCQVLIRLWIANK